MSLINDALRRAREAQKPAPPDPLSPVLRPVEPPPASVRRSSPVLPVLCVALALITIFYAWQWWTMNAAPKQPRDAEPTRVSARTPAEPAGGNSSGAPNSIATSAGPSAPAPVLPNPASAPSQARTEANNTGTGAPVTAASVSAETNAAAASEAPPKVQPLKLQAIVFHPTRPSAMVNGKFLYVGDRIGEYRVTAITRDSATLTGGGKTKLLLLGE